MITGTVPTEALEKPRKVRGGGDFTAVHSWWFEEQLNAAFGYMWSKEVLDHGIFEESDEIWALVRLTIHLPGGAVIVKNATGGRPISRYESDEFVRDGSGNIVLESVDGTQRPKVKHRKGDAISLRDNLEAAITLALTGCARDLGFASEVYNKREE
jgi:hypothetical protein